MSSSRGLVRTTRSFSRGPDRFATATRWNTRLLSRNERFFVARTIEYEVRPQLPDGYVSDHRWWKLPEIQATHERFSPTRLAELLPPILCGEYPASTLDCGI